MNRNGAIEYIKWYFTEDDGIAADAKVKEAIQALVPELKESEDERIRKRLIDCLKFSLKGAEEQDAAGCSRQKDIEAYKWGIAYLEKQKEQKPAEWSEGDSVILNEIIDFFENGTVRLQHDLSMYAQWLKSLRPQPKHEWSEEEKKTISFVIDVLRANHPDGFFKTSPAGDIHVTGITVEKLIKKLESLLSRPKLSDNWKPTEEQLHALYLASYGGELSSEDCLELDSLLIDLKKLYSL